MRQVERRRGYGSFKDLVAGGDLRGQPPHSAARLDGEIMVFKVGERKVSSWLEGDISCLKGLRLLTGASPSVV